MAKSNIRKDRAIRWNTTDNDNNPISYVGMLKLITPTHYTIDIPGLGELAVERDDGEFDGAPMIEYRAAITEAELEQNEPEPMETVEPITETVNETVESTESNETSSNEPSVARRGRSNTDRQYAAAAITLRNGKYKLRFSGSASRYAIALSRSGHKEIVITDLPCGNKVQLAGELMLHPQFQYPIAQEVIAEFLAANS